MGKAESQKNKEDEVVRYWLVWTGSQCNYQIVTRI